MVLAGDHLEVAEPGQRAGDHHGGLGLAEPGADAVVQPVPHGDVRVRRPVEDHLVGPVEHGRVAVGGPVAEPHPVTRADLHAAELGVGRRGPRQHRHRAVVAQELLHGRRDHLRLPGQQPAGGRVGAQVAERAQGQLGRRGHPGDDEQEARAGYRLVVERAPRPVEPRERGDEVVARLLPPGGQHLGNPGAQDRPALAGREAVRAAAVYGVGDGEHVAGGQAEDPQQHAGGHDLREVVEQVDRPGLDAGVDGVVRGLADGGQQPVDGGGGEVPADRPAEPLALVPGQLDGDAADRQGRLHDAVERAGRVRHVVPGRERDVIAGGVLELLVAGDEPGALAAVAGPVNRARLLVEPGVGRVQPARLAHRQSSPSAVRASPAGLP